MSEPVDLTTPLNNDVAFANGSEDVYFIRCINLGRITHASLERSETALLTSMYVGKVVVLAAERAIGDDDEVGDGTDLTEGGTVDSGGPGAAADAEVEARSKTRRMNKLRKWRKNRKKKLLEQKQEQQEVQQQTAPSTSDEQAALSHDQVGEGLYSGNDLVKCQRWEV